MNIEHHTKFFETMQCNTNGSCANGSLSKMEQSDANKPSVITYINCTLNVTNNNNYTNSSGQNNNSNK